MTGRDVAFMHAELARNAGIFLDETPRAKSTAPARVATTPSDEERAEIRSIIVEAGAPMAHVEWLARSCPSVDDAMTYKPSNQGGRR